MRFCNRQSLSTLVICLLHTIPLTGAEVETSGAASCRRPSPGESCLTAWDFAAAPRAFFWVEKFVHAGNTDEWQSVAGPFSSEKGVSSSSVEGGYLYRVVGCNDKTKAIECTGSTVFWAPLRPKDVESIPDRIDTPEGYYLRHKRSSELEQVIDYNRAILRKLVLEIDMMSMPPMTALPFDDLWDLPNDVDVGDATIDYNLQFAYPNHLKPIR